MMLRFSSRPNGKLRKLQDASGKKARSLDLQAGVSCPFAKACKSTAVRGEGNKCRVVDGPHCEYRCYAASEEAFFTETYNFRRANYLTLKGAKTVAELVTMLETTLPKADIIRIHASGDFFSFSYFQAWVKVAKNHPDMLFYAYTKALRYWVKMMDKIPSNFNLIASKGGVDDHLIKEYNLRNARVVYTMDEANQLGLRIDNDDSIACFGTENFAILLHGIQPVNSKASKYVLKGRNRDLSKGEVYA